MLHNKQCENLLKIKKPNSLQEFGFQNNLDCYFLNFKCFSLWIVGNIT
jgi:hypothetical protein